MICIVRYLRESLFGMEAIMFESIFPEKIGEMQEHDAT